MMRGAKRSGQFRRWLGDRGFPARPLIGDDGNGVSRVVVIPALAESRRLFQTLEDLARSPVGTLNETLVICVVNNRAEPRAMPEQIADNRKTLLSLDKVIQRRARDQSAGERWRGLRLAYVDASSPGNELAAKMGVGEARRIGLDHGLSILADNLSPDGLLISLDADSRVAPGYLDRVADHFEANDSGAAVVAYSHPLPEGGLQREAVLLYELFLRYHELGLQVAGSPYAIPTIGSTIVVRGGAYVAAGGMNRKQAGEDFYFLQQLVKTGSVSRIETTTVEPAPRASNRVPFGTGASVGRHLAGDECLKVVYNPDCYRVLEQWLSLVRRCLTAPVEDLLEAAGAVEPQLEEFLMQQGFEAVWPKLQKNASDLSGLGAQFHRWFDGFKTLKLIHHLRDRSFASIPVEEAVTELFEHDETGRRFPPDGERLTRLLDSLRRACRDRRRQIASVRCWDAEMSDGDELPGFEGRP